jgi:hypothetical protein
MILFLVENKNQLNRTKAIIKELPRSLSYSHYALNRNAPFFIDNSLTPDSLFSWKSHSFHELSNNRFWLKNYKNIDHCLLNFKGEKTENKTIHNKYLGIDLCWKIGNDYIQPLLHFKNFIETNKVSTIYLKLRNDFISNSIQGICGLSGTIATHIFDHKY